MRVELVRSGGLHGIRRSAILDTEALDRDAGDDLRRLVWEADLTRVGETTLSVSPDRFRYTLIVQEGARRESLSFPEDRVPDSVRPLFERLSREMEGFTGPAVERA
jgi:hypothetical protein